MAERQQGVITMSTPAKNGIMSTRTLVQLALLTAIIAVMSFTPVGYLKTPLIEISFIPIPMVVGAILLGPAAGAFLGGVFWITSFIQCFGMSQFGATLLAIDPLLTFILCFFPRLLAGLCCGFLFRALDRRDKTKHRLLSYSVGALSGALFNTVFFVGTLILLFGRTDYIRSIGDTVPKLIAAIVGLNGVIEAVVCMIVGAAVSKALNQALRKLK